MKQAILITAYRDLKFICSIIEYFDNDDDFEFYIHIDRKCREDSSVFSKYKHVYVYSCYKIVWGSVNHSKAILYLMQKALKGNAEFFHLITGSDYPVKKLSEFKSFFEKHRLDNFIEYFPLPRKSWGNEGGLERIKYYWIRSNSSRVQGAKFVRLFLRLQKKINISRKFKYFDGNIWGGGTYWSLSQKAVKIVVNYTAEHPGYMRRFKYTSISEEIFIQTILKNTINIQLTNDYLRYIDWGKGGFAPIVLTEEDYSSIVNSNCFFARKFDKTISSKLINML